MDMNQNIGETCDKNNSQIEMVDYMLLHNSSNDHHHQEEEQQQFGNETSLVDKLNFQDVMQFADFGGPPRLMNEEQGDRNHHQDEEEETNNGIDPIFFLKFPVLNDHHLHDQEEHEHDHLMFGSTSSTGNGNGNNEKMGGLMSSEQQVMKINNKKKRARSIKTSEEVESQRMTHIAVERNRRKQMNEHLRVLRSLMPASYVQRGDQASIIGGAIEFVRELEQLLQCLESQKRRRLYGDNCPPPPPNPIVVGGASSAPPAPLVMVDQDQHQQLLLPQQPPQPPFFPGPPPLNNNNDQQLNQQLQLLHETTASHHHDQEEIAESKSCIADIEVKLLGFDAMIKILSRRRPGQLVKTIAALEDLQIIILHTNITTIDQTVLYSFTVKVGGEARLTAEDIANSVQQIFTFIHAYDNI